MIAMRVWLSSRAPFVLAAASLLFLSCGVDESGLGQKPFLPHDAAAGDTSGAAGASGGSQGTAGVGGAAPTGVAGAGGAAGAMAGIGGGAGDTGVAGTDGGPAGSSGTTGVAGDGGGVAGSGEAGMGGDSGVAGAGGGSGVAGMGGLGGGGPNSGGASGGPGGVGGGAVGGRGGGGVAGAGGRGGAGGGGRGGNGGVCNQLNCNDGCCDAGVCVRMRTAQRCGSGGNACTACAACNLCSAMGQCRIDPASRWTIVAVSATLNGGGWDRNFGDVGGSAPDPFCEFENPAGQVSSTTAGVTDTVVDDASATWNQEITPPGLTVAASTLMANNPTWQIWVGDDDGCNGPQGCLGDIACTYAQTIPEATLRSGMLTINNRMSCTSLTLQFVCKSPLAGDESTAD
jgi:hypothetical protein